MHAAVIKMSDNGWMNEDLTMEWIATVWNGSVDLEVQNECKSAWDTFKCHFTSSVKSRIGREQHRYRCSIAWMH